MFVVSVAHIPHNRDQRDNDNHMDTGGFPERRIPAMTMTMRPWAHSHPLIGATRLNRAERPAAVVSPTARPMRGDVARPARDVLPQSPDRSDRPVKAGNAHTDLRREAPLATILLVVDDSYHGDLLRFALEREDFTVLAAPTGRSALQAVRALRPALVLLDDDLLDANGLALLASLRAFSHVPVVLLTARDTDEDVIAGFAMGADDYVVKPFNTAVLVTRVQAILRRARTETATLPVPPPHETFEMYGAIFDPTTNSIAGPTARIELTPTESRILYLLVRHEGQALSSARIMERTWKFDTASLAGVVKTHIYHLRTKIARLPGAPRPIRTVEGGYLFSHDTAD